MHDIISLSLTISEIKTMKDIFITVRHVFGNQNVYPACETSEVLAKLMRKKTFSTGDFESIKKLGFNMKFKQQSIEGIN